VIGVRTFALRSPQAIHVKPEYLGCRSWVSVDDEIDIEGSLPALTETELEARLNRVQALLP